MKLFVTFTSPYARMARIVVEEKSLVDRVELIEAQTRRVDSPYYEINPSGRVPYLIAEDGTVLEDSSLICAYLDHLDGCPIFDHLPANSKWESMRLEALARSLMDGLCVWGRELTRPYENRSLSLIEHEQQRSVRMTSHWEKEVDHPLMRGDLNFPQIALVCALQLERRNPNVQWRHRCPNLSRWVDNLSERRSIQRTMPPL